MREIRELTRADNESLITIMANAYPGISIVSDVDRKRFWERTERMVAEPTVKNWGLFTEENGRAHQQSQATPDAAIELDVADFSSLVMGAVGFRRLVAYRLAQIADAAFVDPVDRLFHTPHKPVCMTAF